MFNLLFCVGVIDEAEPPASRVWGCAALNKVGRRYQISHTWDHTLTSLTPTISGVNVSQQ
ncbi:hypothetical protein DPMN_087507 [Dreissena polymorpha]|uniref:Uncharacterized protein n=1 Tax=Dreissena polymorpha TaxID=45954 RepID=A0A9D4KU20_DREPO|nr:hypothetical protein DPMN_087507 [Dreissena polymorpha]